MSRVLITYSASRIALFVVSLPLLSFVFCVLYSLVFSFNESTETHCKVANLLPSISAAIGNFSPQKYVWRTGIGIHSAPRYVYAWMYRSLHCNELPAQYRYLADVAFVLEIIEDTCLLGLTMVSSSENYPIHERCFITFLVTAILYMVLCAFILPKLQHRRGPYHRQSLAIKRKASWTTLICSLLCAITFYRHNSHCEPYMYTAFALSEYLIVLSNIVFHGTAYYDFHGANIVVGCGEEDASLLLKRQAAS